MGLQRVIDEICWQSGRGFDPYATTVLSDETLVRVDRADDRPKLRLNDDFRYSTSPDLYVRSYVIEAAAMERVEVVELLADLPDGTSVGFRLFDGTDEWWWDGAAWDSAPVAGEWNTEAEVNQNLPTFDTVARKFGVTLNLVTTDDKVTPEVTAVRVLWRGHFDWTEDLVGSLVARGQEALTFEVVRALPPLPADATSLDLDDYASDPGSGDLEFVSAVAAYDHELDPNQTTDILDSYDVGTGVVTFSRTVVAGTRVILRMNARVEVAWDTHRDFEPIGKLPQVILRNSETVTSSPYPMSFGGEIVRRDTSEATYVPPAYRMTFRFEAEVRTDRVSREEWNVVESFQKFLRKPAGEIGPFLRSRAVGHRVRIQMLDEFATVDLDEKDGDVASQTVVFALHDAPIHLEDAVDLPAVQRLKLFFANVTSAGRTTALAAGAPVPHSPFEEIEGV